MPLPNLIIIGAMKCGTTSMHQYLRKHRQIAMSGRKELDFFIAGRGWEKGVDWYASQFPAGTPIRGESSPNYTASQLFAGVPARMHQVVPGARLLFMVRDPIERLVSHWMHNYSNGRESRPLADVILEDRYVGRSLYWTQIAGFLEYYPRSQILVVGMDELAADRQGTVQRVLRFLEVDTDFRVRTSRRKNSSTRRRRKTAAGNWIAGTHLGKRVDALPDRWRWAARQLLYYPFSRRVERPELPDPVRRRLVDRIRDDAHRFREFAGRDFSGWSV
jgi:hypothetical protein